MKQTVAACILGAVALSPQLVFGGQPTFSGQAPYVAPNQTTLNFCSAAINKNLAMMALLAQQGADVNNENCQSWDADTPLMRAVGTAYNDMGVVNFLLSHGANVNYQNKFGQTALMYLVKQQWNDPSTMYHGSRFIYQAMPALMTHGANVNLQDIAGNTALLYLMAAGYSSGTVRQFMYELTTLKDHGADINHQNKKGQTALMMAAQGCGLESVQTLLSMGANPALKDSTGATALSLATNSAAAESTDTTCNQVVQVLMNPAQYAKPAADGSAPASMSPPATGASVTPTVSASAPSPVASAAQAIQGITNALSVFGHILTGK